MANEPLLLVCCSSFPPVSACSVHFATKISRPAAARRVYCLAALPEIDAAIAAPQWQNPTLQFPKV